jgi:hypothetical protein
LPQTFAHHIGNRPCDNIGATTSGEGHEETHGFVGIGGLRKDLGGAKEHPHAQANPDQALSCIARLIHKHGRVSLMIDALMKVRQQINFLGL